MTENSDSIYLEDIELSPATERRSRLPVRENEDQMQVDVFTLNSIVDQHRLLPQQNNQPQLGLEEINPSLSQNHPQPHSDSDHNISQQLPQVGNLELTLFALMQEHNKRNYVCGFCQENGYDPRGHLPNKCHNLKMMNDAVKHNPVLSRQWGAYKFSKINVEAKKQKEIWLKAKKERKEVKAKKTALKSYVATTELLDIQEQINSLKRNRPSHITIPKFNADMLMSMCKPNPSAELPERLKALRTTVNDNLLDSRLIHNDYHESCSLCLTDMALNSLVVELTCGHHFHPTCFSQHVERGYSICPIDRRTLSSN